MQTQLRRLAFAVLLASPAPANSADVATPSADDGKPPIRGIIRAVQQATISTDLQARVARVGFQDGERFKKGDVLVEFDCRKQRAELAAVDAQRHEMQLSLDNNMALQRAQAVGRHDLEISKARVAKAAAEVEALRSRVDQCRLLAPFDGRVADLTIHAHETPQPGKPFIGIVAEGSLEIDLVLPSEWLRWISPTSRLSFTVDETQKTHEARLLRLGATVDAISQTIKAVAVFEDSDIAVLPGMSGSAEFK